MASRQTAKKIRYILSEMEAYLGRDCDCNKTTLEHICPYNPENGWVNSFGEGVNDIKDRLGNMVLLDKDNLRRSSFIIKRDEYSKSTYKLALKVCEYGNWNLEAVNEHQKWMSTIAAKTWEVT
jgi:hypothetical protein